MKYPLSSSDCRHSRTALFVAAFVGLILTAFAYWPGLHGDFVLDDFPNLLENRALQIDSFSLEAFWQAALSSGAGTLRRPLSMFSFAVNHYLSEYDPLAYKVTNLGIHLLCGIALFVLTSRLLSAYREFCDEDVPQATVRWAPMVVAAFWLIHPINVTGVLYIVQRMTSLAALFTVLAVIAWVTWRRRRYEGRKNWLAPFVVSIAFTVLGLLSKENAALVPAFAILIEAAIFRGRTLDGRIDNRVVWFFLLLLVLPVLLTVSFLVTNPGYILNGYEGRTFSLGERLLTESRVLMLYLQWIIVPSASSLGLYHDDVAVSTGLLTPPTTALAVAAIFGMLAIGTLLLRRAPIVSLGILWFFAGHTLESTIIPLELVYEHRNYLPSYGILLGLGYALFQLAGRLHLNKLAVALGSVALLVFSAVTFVRAQQWQDNITHAITEANNHPRSPRAVYMAGRIYANLYLTGGIDSPTRAYEYLERASALDGDSILPSAALVMFAAKSSEPIRKAWPETIISQLEQTPLTPASVTTLKILTADPTTVAALGHDTIETILGAALRNPAAGGGKRADLLTILGSYRANFRRDYDSARLLFDGAVRSAPRELRYRINLIRLLVATGDANAAREALAHARRADKLKMHAGELGPLEEAIDAIAEPG